MANEADVTVRVKTIDDGSRGMQTYAKSLGGVKVSALAFAGTLGAAAIAGKKLYDTLRAGAVLETTEKRFDKLAESIGTTADSMLGKLRTATQGMISDMDLMSSASQIVSLKLADNSDQVVRLATVAGTLNWDMQQVILTFANMSTMRLDALGLSVEEVKNKAKELEKQGMSAQAAFKEAVILAGEARLDVGGVGETEKAFKQLEAAIANSKSEFSLFAIELAKSVGLIDAMSQSVREMQLDRMAREAKEAGEITRQQFAQLASIMRESGVASAELALEQMKVATALGQTNSTLVVNIESYRMWSGATTAAMNAAAAASDAITARIIANVTAADAVLMQTVRNWQREQAARPSAQAMTNRYAGWMSDTNERNRAAETERQALLDATKATYGYGGSLAYVNQEAQAAAEAQQRFMSAFDAELMARVEDGLINEQGLVNVEAMNAALYEQSKAAGASAITLALLGAATGQFTEEQAEAALKAAVLQERIVQLAKGIASGQVSFGDALSGLTTFKQNLDQTGAGSLPETVAQLVAGIPADDRTIAYLSDTSVVDDDLRRLRGTVVEIPVRYSPINDPTQTRGGAIYISPPTIAPPPVTPVNPIIAPPKPPRPPKPPYDPTRMDIQMNLNFHGPANANDVKNGVTEGMKSFFDGLRIEGVPV